MNFFEEYVCGESYSGTDDYVRFIFKNKNKEQCVSKWLDNSGNDHATGQKYVWDGDWLEACFNFRPEDGLWVKIETKYYGLNTWSDDIHICRINAKFGWDWWEFNSGSSKKGVTNSETVSAQRSSTKWIEMCKRCTNKDDSPYCCSKWQDKINYQLSRWANNAPFVKYWINDLAIIRGRLLQIE